jgi:hypothetical protein
MTIDNSPIVIRDRKLMWVLGLILIAILSFILFSDFYDNPILGKSREFYAIIISVLYVITNVYRFFLDLNFINYSDQEGKITLRYFSLRPFMQKHKSIEISKNSFIKYEIISKAAGLKKYLILYQRVQHKVAKYPPISITALSNDELNSILASLNSIASVKN